MDKKNSVIAALLSLLIAGAGQLYLRQYKKAAGYFLLEVLSAAIYARLDPLAGQLLSFFASVLSAVDGYRAAIEMNRKTVIEADKKEKPEGVEREVYMY